MSDPNQLPALLFIGTEERVRNICIDVDPDVVLVDTIADARRYVLRAPGAPRHYVVGYGGEVAAAYCRRQANLPAPLHSDWGPSVLLLSSIATPEQRAGAGHLDLMLELVLPFATRQLVDLLSRPIAHL